MSTSLKGPSKVGFVTTCKGRLHHLRRTLPQIVAQAPDEIVVVDHDCPQESGAWVKNHYPEVKVVHINDGAPFVVSKARNVGIRACSSEMICLIDADVSINPGFVDWIRQNATERRFFRQDLVDGRRMHDTWGTFVCPRNLLLEIGLYDEAFDGWGGEDNDLYYRLRVAGSIEDAFPSSFVTAISHDNQERFLVYDTKDKSTHLLMNELYTEMKRIASALGPRGFDIPIEWRKKVRSEIKNAILNRQSQTIGPLDFKLSITTNSSFLSGYRITKNVRVELLANRITDQQSD